MLKYSKKDPLVGQLKDRIEKLEQDIAKCLDSHSEMNNKIQNVTLKVSNFKVEADPSPTTITTVPAGNNYKGGDVSIDFSTMVRKEEFPSYFSSCLADCLGPKVKESLVALDTLIEERKSNHRLAPPETHELSPTSPTTGIVSPPSIASSNAPAVRPEEHSVPYGNPWPTLNHLTTESSELKKQLSELREKLGGGDNHSLAAASSPQKAAIDNTGAILQKIEKIAEECNNTKHQFDAHRASTLNDIDDLQEKVHFLYLQNINAEMLQDQVLLDRCASENQSSKNMEEGDFISTPIPNLMADANAVVNLATNILNNVCEQKIVLDCVEKAGRLTKVMEKPTVRFQDAERLLELLEGMHKMIDTKDGNVANVALALSSLEANLIDDGSSGVDKVEAPPSTTSKKVIEVLDKVRKSCEASFKDRFDQPQSMEENLHQLVMKQLDLDPALVHDAKPATTTVYGIERQIQRICASLKQNGTEKGFVMKHKALLSLFNLLRSLYSPPVDKNSYAAPYNSSVNISTMDSSTIASTPT